MRMPADIVIRNHSLKDVRQVEDGREVTAVCSCGYETTAWPWSARLQYNQHEQEAEIRDNKGKIQPIFLGGQKKKRVEHKYWLYHISCPLPDIPGNSGFLTQNLYTRWLFVQQHSKGYKLIASFYEYEEAMLYGITKIKTFIRTLDGGYLAKHEGDLYAKGIQAPPQPLATYLQEIVESMNKTNSIKVAKKLDEKYNEIVGVVDLMGAARESMWERIVK